MNNMNDEQYEKWTLWDALGVFQCFLNCANGTRLRKASLIKNNEYSWEDLEGGVIWSLQIDLATMIQQ